MSTPPAEGAPKPAPSPTGAPSARSPWTVRRIVVGVLVVYAVLLALLNLRSISVNFVFFSTSASLFIVILLAVGLGFLLGWLFDDLRARRK